MIEDKILPEAFKARIADSLGKEIADVLLPALNTEPDTSIRININKPPHSPLYKDMEEVAWCRSASYLKERPRFTMNPLLHAGAFYVQDASSTVYETLVRNLGLESPVRAADLCAAPGGKTTAVLNALPEGSVMLANEFVGSRANILRENLCKYGYPDVIVTNADVARLKKMKGMFDLICVDAPCSGEGMMRKEAAARTQWSEGLIKQCAALQREIIDDAVEMLAPGGYLIYSTCTFNTEEDEDNAAYIADTCGLTPVETGLAGRFGIQPEVKGTIPCLRFMPGFTRGEGLFVSVFRKEEGPAGSEPKKRKKSVKKGKAGGADAKMLADAGKWVTGGREIHRHGDSLLALSAATAEMIDRIPKDVRIMAAGVELAEIKGKDLIPSHALAMSTASARTFAEVELTEEEALRYLSREAITLPPDTPKGYITVTFDGFPLGMVKNLGNRCNNLYPQEYRIRNKV